MTIASCYISPEGIVLGADSTTTVAFEEGNHYFNHAQKLYEIGENSTFGIVTWGLGGLVQKSYRTLVALLDDHLKIFPPATVKDVADAWIEIFWPAYRNTHPISDALAHVEALHRKPPYDPQSPANPQTRTESEEKQYNNLRTGLVVGFCIGGYALADREPTAFEIVFDPLAAKPAPAPIAGLKFWGAPNMITRLLRGCDDPLLDDILRSGKWNGTPQELHIIVQKHEITHPPLPIRDAIDFTHACIMSTIKALKFSSFSQICGGPIEIAVITTDRKFRWVRHKPWDTAITEGDL